MQIDNQDRRLYRNLLRAAVHRSKVQLRYSLCSTRVCEYRVTSPVPLVAGAIPRQSLSLVLGLLGVASFSLTLPVTRVAVRELDPTFIASGRALVAAALAAVVLLVCRSRVPQGWQWPRLFATAAGVVIGFPLFATWAMKSVPSTHGAVVVGLAPLVTALFGGVLAGERLSRVFWLSTALGSASIVVFSLWSSQGNIEVADLLLIAAVVSASYGYAEGARLSKELGSWQTISWALIVAAPFMILPAWATRPPSFQSLSFAALSSFAYVSVVSMWLGFFAWYRALALGGIGRVGQLQLLQPFMTIFAAALFFGEPLSWLQCLIAIVVLLCVVAGRRSPPARKDI
jgi:drug/metabolite transporter (DMT)-like permease